MASVRGTISVNIENCKGCELCIDACPQESMALSKQINNKGYRYAVLIQDNCTGCSNCALVCPDAVITVFRERKNSSRTKGEKKEPVAVISNVKSNIKVVLDEIPEGGVNI
jgi:2-oxoglutarate ferredoxin oxidoreductase subunit delta